MKHLNSYNFVIPVLLSFVFFSCSDLGDSEVMGCTNPTACNYDSNATEDDGTCGTPDEVCDYCLDGEVIDGDDDNDLDNEEKEVEEEADEEGCEGGGGGV